MPEPSDPVHVGAFLNALAGRAPVGEPSTPRPVTSPEVAQEIARRRLREQHVERVQASIPRRFQTAEPSEPAVLAWVDHVLGGGTDSLVILGHVGTGKTHEAYGAIRRLLLAAPTPLATEMWSVPDLLERLRPGSGSDAERRDLLTRVRECLLLLLDDITAEQATGWTVEKLYQVVNYRYEAMLPMVATCNVGGDEFRRHVGDRVASRLAGMAPGRIVTLTETADRRRAK